MFNIEYVSTNVIESQPFEIKRPEGSFRYIFFHFMSKVSITINGETIDANPGSCILYSPGFPQYFKVLSNRLNHDYVDFTISDDTFFEKIKFPLNTLLYPRMSEDINGLIKKIKKEKDESKKGSEQVMNAYLSLLYVEIVRRLSKESQSRIKYDNSLKEKFEKLRLKMYQVPDKLDVKTLADELGFSLSYFNNLYKSFFNVTPIKDLTIARVERVREMIDCNYSTKTIISTLGFVSEEYFYRWFKKEFGMTKIQYEENKNNKI